MSVIDDLRTIFRIRKPRQIPPPTTRPKVGSNIVLGKLRMRLNYPITSEQWIWLSDRGWRTTDMRNDRRHYSLISDLYVQRLLNADHEQREELHQRMLDTAQNSVASKA